MIGLDTNVLARYIVQDDPAQARAATTLVESGCTADDPGWVSVVVLCELVWVLERGYRYTPEQVAGVVRGLLTARDLLVEDSELAWRAMERRRSCRADFADILIGLRNTRDQAAPTYTFDRQAGLLAEFKLLA
jgi:predicted nucleic-acid-binding protein